MSDFWRFLVILFGGCAGLCFGAASWFLAGVWWTSRAAEAHPAYGEMDWPSNQVIEAVMLTLLCTPLAALAGAFAGVGLAEWLARWWGRSRTGRHT